MDVPPDWEYWELVYDHPLYTGAETRKIYPGLASRMEYSDDYTRLTFYLRKGITWQGGWGEVTAEDFKYSIERNMAKTSTNPNKRPLNRSVAKIEVVDPYRIVFHLKRPDPIIWWVFMTSEGLNLPVMCKKYIEKVGDDEANRHPIGSGPYRLVEHKSGDYLKFEAVEDHWRVVPEFRYLIMRAVPSLSTRVAMLKTGEVDVSQISPDKIAELKKAGLNIIQSPGGFLPYLNFGGMMDTADKRYRPDYHLKDPWADVKVREAMNLAIDRGAIVKAIYKGAAKQIAVPWLFPGWDEQVPIPYDPKRAKQLLAEAGYPSGFSFDIWSHPFPPVVEMPSLIEAIAGYWENIGLSPKIVNTTWQAVRSKVFKISTAGVIWCMRQSYQDDWTMRMATMLNVGSAFTNFQSPGLSAEIAKLKGVLEPKKREAVFKEITKYVRNNHVAIPIVLTQNLWGVSKKVGEWPQSLSHRPLNFVYIRHAEPLNTPRIFTPN
jgi:peptide/nickel transport system substrate-binding protein